MPGVALNGTLSGTTLFGGNVEGSGSRYSVTKSPSTVVAANGAVFGAAGLPAPSTFFYRFRPRTPVTSGKGTVCKMSLSGVKTMLDNFRGGTDGQAPIGNLATLNGRLYGTTTLGGSDGKGTVFTLLL